MANLKLEDADFNRIRDYFMKNYGINLQNKRTLIEGRLSYVIQQEGFKSFHDFIDAAIRKPNGDLMTLLITKLTTNYTYFMRESAHYEFMVSTALPELTKLIKDRRFKIWSAGCSSGEEPYTTAIVMSDYLQATSAVRGWSVTIRATDISQKVLTAAREGVYPAESLGDESDKSKGLTPAQRSKYFTELEGNNYRVKPAVKSLVQFGTFNLMDSIRPEFTNQHIIFCRNVMIYFDTPTRVALINRFYDSLIPGGYLFIGHSETIPRGSTKFEYVKPAIYRKGLS